MNYLEAIAILRLNPDNLPPNLAHLPDEATRVVKLHKTMLEATNSETLLQLPVISVVERARINAVLVYNLAMVCGRLHVWGGPGKKPPIKPIECRPGETAPPRGLTAQPGDTLQMLGIAR